MRCLSGHGHGAWQIGNGDGYGTVGLAWIRDGPRNPQSRSLLLLSLLTTLLEIHEN